MSDVYLWHVTLNTGHGRRSPRDEVTDEAVEQVRALLHRALAAHAPVPLIPDGLQHFSIQASGTASALIVTILAPAGPHQVGRPYDGGHTPLATIGVACTSKSAPKLWEMLVESARGDIKVTRPQAPWVAALLYPGAAHHAGALSWLGDFERLVAWAWIESK